MNFHEILGMGIGFVLLGLFLGLLLGALFLYWGACIASIPNRSFGRAFLANFLCIVAAIVTSVILGALPVVQILVYLFLSFILIKTVFSTSFGKAVIAWLMQMILPAIIAAGIALAGFLFAGAAH